ncbi:putative O-glycosylation ligase, exosortase A system-associated [Belnapia moabensis]|uniref:putative O-glycosylation ligase, exosortase A system-associated n=1 Tax=Belnapia moabensis TaxID=365533 RepID=UPI0005BD8595|nr:putative O-glycosylation ligase, exosortase A system-associated [Belnapia moabensis]
MRSFVFIGLFGALLPLAFVQPFVGALLWCWIAFMNPHREVWGFAQNQPYAMIVFVILVAACIVKREPKRFEANAVTVLLIVFAVLITLTSLTSIAPPALTWSMWERLIKTILGALLVGCLLTSRERIHALIWLMALSIGFYGVKGGIFTLKTGGSFIVLGPPDTMITDRNHLAVAILLTVPLLNYLRMQSPHKWVRLGLMVSMGLMIVAAVGSQSRGALVALGATCVVMWLRSRSKILGGVLMAVCVAGTINFMPQGWVDRMNTISTYEEDTSAMGRVKIWQASWLIALDRPYTGAGFRGPYQQSIIDEVMPGTTARAVHSIYFEVLGEHGFPTFIVWLGLSAAGAYYAWRLIRLSRRRPDLAWAGDFGRMAQVSMVTYLSGGTFLSLSYWDFYWTLLIVVAATHACVVRALGAEAHRPEAVPLRLRPAIPGRSKPTRGISTGALT